MIKDQIKGILTEKNLFSHDNQGVLVVSVKDSSEGLLLALEMITKIIDIKTLLLLSGGRTPKDLYTSLATHEDFHPGAVGMVDERYGKKWHEKSNEKMFQETGLLRYLQMRDVPFYPILAGGMTREDTAIQYDEKLRSLFAIYQKVVAIVGIGADGHTAGIPIRNSEFRIQNSKLGDEYTFVTDYNDESGVYGERVTMTFLGLSMMDLSLLLVFGDDKKKALHDMFEFSGTGGEDAIPARFYLRPEIAKKSILITDQNM